MKSVKTTVRINPALNEEAKKEAKAEGKSLSGYIVDLIKKDLILKGKI